MQLKSIRIDNAYCKVGPHEKRFVSDRPDLLFLIDPGTSLRRNVGPWVDRTHAITTVADNLARKYAAFDRQGSLPPGKII